MPFTPSARFPGVLGFVVADLLSALAAVQPAWAAAALAVKCLKEPVFPLPWMSSRCIRRDRDGIAGSDRVQSLVRVSVMKVFLSEET